MRVMPPKGGTMPHGHWFSAMRFSAHGFLFSDRINKMDKMTPTKSNGTDSENSVHSVEKSGSDRINKMDEKVSENPTVPDATNSENSVNSVQNSLPNSKKVFVNGKLHPDLRVPFREISLAPTKTMSGEIEVNEPVRVYDTSGPWGDETFRGEVEKGLPPLRTKWIRDRGDVDAVAGREVTSADNGYLSEARAEHAAKRNGNSKSQPPSSRETPSSKLQAPDFVRREILRAKSHAVTQLYYARKGVVTSEMEFIAIRENLGRANLGSARASRAPFGASPNDSDLSTINSQLSTSYARNDLRQQHVGNSFGANIPDQIRSEFVREEVARGRAIIPS